MARSWLVCVAACALSASTPAALAQEGGIHVVATGEVLGQPTALEFYSRLAGTGELGNDAMVRFEQYRKQALSTVAELGIENLEVEVGGLSVCLAGDEQQMYMMPGMIGGFDMDEDGAAPRAGLNISGGCRISVRGIEAMSEKDVLHLAMQLIDELRDAGVQPTPSQQAQSFEELDIEAPNPLPAMATFVLEDAQALREEARAKAFSAAKAKAEKLAALAEVKLGPVLAISESSSQSVNNYQYNDYYGYYSATVAESGDGSDRIKSRTFKPIPVRVTMEVHFAIQP